MHQEPLNAIANLLNGSGWNYSVFLRSYDIACTPQSSSEELIRSALGARAVVGGCREVALEEMLDQVQLALSYAGDRGAGPDPRALQSQEFSVALGQLRAEFRAVANRSSKLEQFWLKEGHPAYPVFWDFAFLCQGRNAAVVLVGSSSD